MTAREITDQALKQLETFNPTGLMPALRKANEGAIEDVLNTNGCAYYQWTCCLIELLKPKQVLELGGAMGVWTICALYNLPLDSKLYSITLTEHGLEFAYIVDDYPNLVRVIGDDLDLSNWPKELDLSQTDLWFIDSVHEEAHLRKELNLYSPFFKKGAIILFDDVHLNEGMEKVWEDIRLDKYGKMNCVDATNPLHYSGYGVCIKLTN